MRRIVELTVSGLFTIYGSVAWASSGAGPDLLIVIYFFPMLLVLLSLLKRRFFSTTVIIGIGFIVIYSPTVIAASGGMPDRILLYLFLPGIIIVAALVKRWFLSVPVVAGIIHYYFIYLSIYHRNADSLFYDYHNYVAYTSPLLLVVQIVGVIILLFDERNDG